MRTEADATTIQLSVESLHPTLEGRSLEGQVQVTEPLVEERLVVVVGPVPSTSRHVASLAGDQEQPLVAPQLTQA